MASLIRREPFAEAQSLRQATERFLGDGVGNTARSTAFVAPALDMYETENEYVIRLDVAGIDPQDIEVRLVGNTLTIKGEITGENAPEGKNYIWRERRFGQFMRALEVPRGADASNVAAEFENGILTLIVPKLEETKPKSIQIKIK